MKKLLSLVLVLCMVSVAALAEDTFQELTVDALEGATMQFADLGFSMVIPEVLAQTEVSQEDAASGAFDCYALADGSAYFYMLASEVGADFDFQGYYTSLKTTEGVLEPSLLKINGVAWIAYHTTKNQMVFVTDVNQTLALTIVASPADDEGFVAVMTSVLGSVKPIE